MTPRRSDGRVVPMNVARQLLEQRDQCVEELKRARRRLDALEEERERLGEELDAQRRRADDAEERAAALRNKLEEVEQKLEVADEAAESESRQQEEQDDAMERRARRLAADLKRVQNRTEEQIAAARRDERVRLLKGLGEVLDAVERALQMGGAEGAWREGLEAIRSRFVGFLRDQGARLVGEVGEPMDPDIHQAVATVEAGPVEKGHVARVDRPGIVLDDGTVVRPANVVVAR